MHFVNYMIYFLCMILLLTVSSCRSDKEVNKEIKKDYYEVLENYVINNKEYDNFLLIPANKFISLRDDVDIEGYLLGPLYPEMIDLLKVNVMELTQFSTNQTVFFTSDYRDLFIEKDLFFKTIKDSVYMFTIYGKKQFDRTPCVNFLKRSIMISFKQKMIINHQPDTLFLPKIIVTEMKAPSLDVTHAPDM